MCVFMFSNTSTWTGWKGLFWLHQLKYYGQVNLGNKQKTSQKPWKKTMRCEDVKCLLEAGSSKDKHTGNFGKTRVLLGFEIPEVHWVSSMIQFLWQFFSVGRKSGTKKLQALKNCKKMMGCSFDSCFQWHSMVSAFFNIPMDGHSMNVRVFSASAWPVSGWSLNDFVSTGITRWCYTRCIWGLLLRVPSQGYRECTIDLLRWYINPMEINKQTKTRPGVFDFLKFGLAKQAT